MNAARKYMRMVQDETWEEHKKHYHGGEEPTGECEWLDNDKGDTALQGEAIFDIIQEAKKTAKEIYDGKWVHQRVPKEALRGVQKGTRILSEASYVARRGETAVGVAPRKGVAGEQDKFSRLGREAGTRQERDLEAYARREGCWIEGVDEKLRKKFGDPAEGGETIAFFDAKNGMVEKLITRSMYEQPIENLDRIALHNWLFPDTAMEVIGFGRTKENWHPDTEPNGMFVIHVRQPMIEIEGSADDAEIDYQMNELGFEKIPKKNKWDSQKWLKRDGSVIVDDLHEENAVYDASGHFCVIDADIRLNTPRLGMGGKYVFNPLN